MHVRRVRDEERGAAAVEFALVAMPLFLVLFGILQFGFIFWGYQIGGHAAREAARVAAVCPNSPTHIEDAGKEALTGAPVSGSRTVVADVPLEQVGEYATVTVSFKTFNLGFFDFISEEITTVEKSARSRIEYVPDGGCTDE